MEEYDMMEPIDQGQANGINTAEVRMLIIKFIIGNDSLFDQRTNLIFPW